MTHSNVKIRSMSFHHRIREGAKHIFNSEHFLGIDPMDHAHFHDIYEEKNGGKPKRKKEK